MSDDHDQGGPQPMPPMPPPPAAGPEKWPARYGLISAALGFIAAQFVIGLVAVFYLSLGGHTHDSAFIMGASILQDLVFVGTAIVVAGQSGRVRAVDFGLRRAPFWPTVGKLTAVALTYFVALAIYSSIAHLTSDDTANDLGAGNSTFGMVGFVLMAAVVAPIAEEFFFRGMVFRALANGMGVVAAAVVSGVLFGALHIDSFSLDRLLQVVALALLGVLFALLYAWSGTLYSTIALHATNNALAVVVFASGRNSVVGVSLAASAWLGMMIFCVNDWRLTDRDDAAPRATIAAGVP
ncbi:MAG: CPBP family intramembrane metalloprotease [Thermoleophilia bacterium]|nr:CPBP family intramembrane metalloprotease [Thermoleophilia bacterium]